MSMVKLTERTFWDLDFLASFPEPVSYECPFALEMIQGNVIIAINDLDLVLRSAEYLDGLNGLLILNQTWIWAVIRVQDTIHDKVAIVRHVAKVTAVCVILYTFVVLRSQTLIPSVRFCKSNRHDSRDSPIPRQSHP